MGLVEEGAGIIQSFVTISGNALAVVARLLAPTKTRFERSPRRGTA
jgi:hypothetical protein